MCQLLGMSSSKPATLDFSFAGFAERGGRTGEHRDGWGIALHDTDACKLIVDHLPSVSSPAAAALRQRPLKARNVVAHIRKATQGRVARENSHPFVRQLWGKSWSFAHNGNLAAFSPAPDVGYVPDGETDSERAFCHLLAGLRQRFTAAPPQPGALIATVAALAGQIARHGSFNFILSDGDLLFAYCSTRLHYVVREYPFATARLLDCDVEIDFNRHNHLDDRIAVIATEPLTSGEQWQAFAPGELKVFAAGAPYAGRRSVYLQVSN